MLELLKSVLDELKRDPVDTGYCMCGSPVDSHGLGDGHGPVDEGQYVRNRVIEQVEAEIECLGQEFDAKDAEILRLREALGMAEDAIAEYYRYQTGGEMRGSYDGKPERANLWKAGHSARAALSEARKKGKGE